MVSTNDLELMFAETNAKLSAIINLLNKFHPSTTDDIFDETLPEFEGGFRHFGFPLSTGKTYTLRNKLNGDTFSDLHLETPVEDDEKLIFIFKPNRSAKGVLLFNDAGWTKHTMNGLIITTYNYNNWVIKEEV
jgi:hypothetical protein